MISIITTFHNSQSHILDCLKSVQMISDSTDFEHILVNDGSTDSSRDILESLDVTLLNHSINLGMDRGIWSCLPTAE